MPTQLDTALEAIIGELTKEGQPFHTTPYMQDGTEMPAFTTSPPTLAHYFAHFCTEHKDVDFLVDGDLRLTFGETYGAAVCVAESLVLDHGVEVGDRIGIAARNSVNWMVAYMGITMAGGCATLLNGFWSGEELAYGIRLAECKIVLADAGRAARLEGTDHSAKLVMVEHTAPADGLKNVWKQPDSFETSQAMKLLGTLGPDDLATILYTSGSTGQSKGAFSDHRGVVAGVMSYVSQSAMAKVLLESQGEDVSAQPCALVAVPLFHVTGEVPLFLQSYAIARKLVLMPKWDAEEALRLMDTEKVTYFVGVPLMSYEIATHPNRDQYDLSSCKSFAAGGAPRPLEHVNKIKEAFPGGFPLLGYGLTETNAVGCGNFNENYIAKPGSTGRASQPLVEVSILDDDGNPVAQGDVAEVCIRSVANFRGYWNNEEATSKAFTADRFFRTGDLGYLDEDGYLYIVDRKKDIIIRGGENLSAKEIEDALHQHPDIREAAVVSMPHERLGEGVCAFLILNEACANLSLVDVAAFTEEQHLARQKIPERIELVEDLPRTPSGKVRKDILRKQLREEKAL